jgi:hypothetical protein
MEWIRQDILDEVLTAWVLFQHVQETSQDSLIKTHTTYLTNTIKGKYIANDTAKSDSSLTSRICAYLQAWTLTSHLIKSKFL